MLHTWNHRAIPPVLISAVTSLNCLGMNTPIQANTIQAHVIIKPAFHHHIWLESILHRSDSIQGTDYIANYFFLNLKVSKAKIENPK